MKSPDRLPLLFRHPSGRGCFKFKGKFYYCGPWPKGMKKPPAETEAKHAAMVLRVVAEGPQITAPQVGGYTLHVAMAAFWKHATKTKGKEAENYKRATSFLITLFGELPITQIGPTKLLALQEWMVDKKYTRQGINKVVNMIKTAFRWLVSREIYPPEMLAGIASVTALEKGATTAPEFQRKRLVKDEAVDKTLPFLPDEIADMVRLQKLTGMRPGEVCRMTTGAIDKSGEVWWYIPGDHKQAWREDPKHMRVIGLGPKCQEILVPWLKFDPEAPLFSPRARMEKLAQAKREKRKTKVQPSQENRGKEPPMIKPGEAYTTRSYCRAVHRACEKAGLETGKGKWSPVQLRKHNAQLVCETFDSATAADFLGHADPEVTRRHYLELAKTRLKAAALQIG